MRRRYTRTFLLAAIAATGIALAGGIGLWVHKREAQFLPQEKYQLSALSLKEWKPYGGTWEILNGSIHNNSDERGAKLITGSADWTDYTLRADLHFDGDHGDMGVIIRSNDEEEGVDAYQGYYAGLRTTDGMLVIGRADYGWMEARPVVMPGGVSDANWYRLTVTSYQCFIAAESQNLRTLQTARIVLEEHPCVNKGRIGLRSLATGGRWRNISVAPAGLADYLRIRNFVASTSQPEFPKREADYNRLPSPAPTDASSVSGTPPPDTSNTQIGDLVDLAPSMDKNVVLRGVVTLTSPDLYIQDSTGGILVKHPEGQTLNVGDVVEVRGRVKPGLYSDSIENSSIRLLWIGTPLPPISVTPGQAASGVYDARFIEIEGRLIGDETAVDGSQILLLTDGIQTFMAVYPHRPGEPPRKFALHSYLRVRGTCAVGRTYARELTPFVVLLPSNDDIQLLADPPWWNPWHESMIFAGVLFGALLIQVAYFRFQRWKSDTLTQERERLAHEIHDTMAQGFAGVGYQIQGIRKTVSGGERMDRQQVSEQLGVAYQLVRRCHEEASRTIAMLSPASPPIQDNLLKTLADAARRISGEQISTVTCTEGTQVPLPLRTANAFLHIGREAVVNAAAHSTPAEIRITLRYAADCVELIVADNGLGFEFTQAKAGFGILGMQKRARDVGGILQIHSAPGAGTEVKISVRLQEESAIQRSLRALGKRLWARA